MLSSQTADLDHPEILRNPHPFLHRLRGEAPVHWSGALGGWLLTRYDDVISALRDPRLLENRPESGVGLQLPPDRHHIVADYVRVTSSSMLVKDGPEHQRLRRLGYAGFTPGALDGFKPIIEQVANELLDRVQPLGRMDLVSDLAQPLPSSVIAQMFDIPEADRAVFQTWSSDVARFFAGTLRDIEPDARAANAGSRNLEQYFLRMIEQRRKRPGNDLMSLFIAGQEEGKLSAQQIAAQGMLVLVAGHVTTIDQLSNTVDALLRYPGELARLRRDRSLLPSAIEESLRHGGAVALVCRVAAEDLTIRDQRISRGDVVYPSLAAANRDPEVFEDPDRFDISRAPNRHVAFSHGPHGCLGAALARRELEVGIGALLRRMPELRRDEQRPAMQRFDSIIFRGFERLPLVF